jgi:hypothetical protein
VLPVVPVLPRLLVPLPQQVRLLVVLLPWVAQLVPPQVPPPLLPRPLPRHKFLTITDTIKTVC